jgi:hypothetical protein
MHPLCVYIYSDNPHSKGKAAAWAITTAEGGPYRNGIVYSATDNSQDTRSILYSTWHSMKADGENITDADAMARGQEFGWNKLFDAANEIKKAGGIDKLKKNSKGIQELGQGVHALQDAVAHHGEDYAHHNLMDDMFPSSNTMNKAIDVTVSALIVTEIMSGDYSHVKDGMTLNVSGMTANQLTSFLQSLSSGMDKNKTKKITINNGQ